METKMVNQNMNRDMVLDRPNRLWKHIPYSRECGMNRFYLVLHVVRRALCFLYPPPWLLCARKGR